MELYQIAVDVDEPFASDVDAAALRFAVALTLQEENTAGPLEISLRVTDDDTIQTLNREYRAIDAPTDVLSFSFVEDDGSFVPAPDGIRHLGEIVIALPYTARSAKRQGHSTARELTVLAVHGTLHVLGYDDEEDEAAAEMQARQDAILALLWQ